MGSPAFRVDHEQLGRWFRTEVEKRTQLVLLGWCTPCGSKHNWGWLKFSVVPIQNFTVEHIIASGYFADSSCCLLSSCSRLEVFNKVMRASWTRYFLWSLKYLVYRKWRQVVHHWWTGAHHVCVSRENWGQLEFPEYFVWTFLIHKLYQFVELFLPWLQVLENIVHNLFPMKSWHTQTSSFGMCRCYS